MSLIGTPDAAPSKVQAPIVDVVTGQLAAVAILGRLHQRDRDGRGGHLDVNLFNAALVLQQASLASYLADGVLPDKIGAAAPYSAPNEAFQTADGWIMVAAYIGDRWARLCRVLGCAELIDAPAFATSQARVRNRTEMRQTLAPHFRSRGNAAWIIELSAADILCAPVADYAALCDHPQLAANRILARWQGQDGMVITAPGFPVDSQASNAVPHSAAPMQGEHSRTALQGIGYTDKEIDALAETGVIRIARPHPDVVAAKVNAR